MRSTREGNDTQVPSFPSYGEGNDSIRKSDCPSPLTPALIPCVIPTGRDVCTAGMAESWGGDPPFYSHSLHSQHPDPNLESCLRCENQAQDAIL